MILGRCHSGTHRAGDRQPSRVCRKFPPPAVPSGGEVFSFERDSHLLTIDPSGQGSKSSIIANLLTYPGPVIAIDPRGECYLATAQARAAMGQKVLLLDPFNALGQNAGSLNPFDYVLLDEARLETNCQMAAELLSLRSSHTDHWEQLAFGLLSGVIGYLCAVPEKKQSPGEIAAVLHSDDVVYNLAVMLDTIGKRIAPMAYREIASYLQLADAPRSRVLSRLTARLKPFMTTEIRKATDDSSVPLTDIIEGNPLSIYIVIPPAKLETYQVVLQVWVNSLLLLLSDRKTVPSQSTLLLLDDCAQLGHCPFLASAITLCRGFGFQVWTFWRDLTQLRGLYPAAWPAILQNCGAIQLFPSQDYSASLEAAALLGIEHDDVRGLDADEQIAWIDGACHRIKNIDCSTDPLCSGKLNRTAQAS